MTEMAIDWSPRATLHYSQVQTVVASLLASVPLASDMVVYFSRRVSFSFSKKLITEIFCPRSKMNELLNWTATSENPIILTKLYIVVM